jgi:hypothetical protein
MVAVVPASVWAVAQVGVDPAQVEEPFSAALQGLAVQAAVDIVVVAAQAVAAYAVVVVVVIAMALDEAVTFEETPMTALLPAGVVSSVGEVHPADKQWYRSYMVDLA